MKNIKLVVITLSFLFLLYGLIPACVLIIMNMLFSANNPITFLSIIGFNLIIFVGSKIVSFVSDDMRKYLDSI